MSSNPTEPGRMALSLLTACASSILFFGAAPAETPPASDAPRTAIDSTTVVAPRDRAEIEREVRNFVNAVAVKPGDESLAVWQTQIPLCPLVAGLPGTDGEYILSRVSKIAAAAGVPLAPEHCKGNLFIVVTSDPEGVIKAWSKRDTRMFGEENDQGSTKVREFNASSPVRAWYNTEFYKLDGTPLGNAEGRTNQSARATRLETNNYRALSSVMVLVDARRMKEVSFGQVAAYVAMVGLAQLHTDAHVTESPSVLNLFAGAGKAPPGLTPWDQSFLKAIYQTRITDKAQLAAIKTAMVQDLAP